MINLARKKKSTGALLFGAVVGGIFDGMTKGAGKRPSGITKINSGKRSRRKR